MNCADIVADKLWYPSYEWASIWNMVWFLVPGLIDIFLPQASPLMGLVALVSMILYYLEISTLTEYVTFVTANDCYGPNTTTNFGTYAEDGGDMVTSFWWGLVIGWFVVTPLEVIGIAAGVFGMIIISVLTFGIGASVAWILIVIPIAIVMILPFVSWYLNAADLDAIAAAFEKGGQDLLKTATA